jgi:hypothetical protein
MTGVRGRRLFPGLLQTKSWALEKSSDDSSREFIKTTFIGSHRMTRPPKSRLKGPICRNLNVSNRIPCVAPLFLLISR